MSKIFGTLTTDALLFFGGVLTALLGYLGVRGSTTAQLQVALNDAFKALTQDLQEERSVLVARVLELEKNELYLTGELRGLLQYNDSLKRQLIAQGIEPISADASPTAALKYRGNQ